MNAREVRRVMVRGVNIVVMSYLGGLVCVWLTQLLKQRA